MASGAGSLNVLIGGPAVYNGTLESRPVLGAGRSAMPVHVVAALRLVERSTLLWLAVFLIGGFSQRGRSWLIRPNRSVTAATCARPRAAIRYRSKTGSISRPASIRAAIRYRRSRRMRGAVCPKTTTVSPPRAARYYGAEAALPVAGSQAAIRALPSLLRRGVAGVAPLTYAEYAPAFERAGHRVVTLDVVRA